MGMQIAAVAAEALSLVLGSWFAVQYFRLRVRCAHLEESERRLRDRTVGAEKRHDRLQDDLDFAIQRNVALKAEMADKVSELEYHYEVLKDYAVYCSTCSSFVLPNIPYSTTYLRDESGNLTDERVFKCDDCQRREDAENGIVDCSSCGCSSAVAAHDPVLCSFCKAGAVGGPSSWDDSTMDELN